MREFECLPSEKLQPQIQLSTLLGLVGAARGHTSPRRRVRHRHVVQRPPRTEEACRYDPAWSEDFGKINPWAIFDLFIILWGNFGSLLPSPAWTPVLGARQSVLHVVATRTSLRASKWRRKLLPTLIFLKVIAWMYYVMLSRILYDASWQLCHAIKRVAALNQEQR